MEQWPDRAPAGADVIRVGSADSTRELFCVSDGIWLMNGPGDSEVDIVATPTGEFAFLESNGTISRTGLAATWEELGTKFP